jgi:hypothetical protein
MVVVGEFPEIKITCTHGGTPYSLEGYHTDTQVTLMENAVNQAVVVATDPQGEVFLNKCDLNDIFNIDLRWLSKGVTWTRRLYGRVSDLAPTLTSDGELVTIRARGSEECLLAMPVGEQYGNQSANPTLNTILEVLTDATKGIVPKWVLKVLNTATDSGYALNTTKIADLASDFKYLYWSYKPAINCLDDMIDLISAANAPNAGAHWIAKYSDSTCYLCIATVGAHENPPSDIWPTWWNTNQAGSTIEVGADMLVSNFTKQRAKANYVLYYGELRKPGDADFWTENQSGLWWKESGTFTDDNSAGNYKVGAYSLKATSTDPSNIYIAYPLTENAAWDMTKWGGKYNIPTLNFWFKRDANTVGALTVFLKSSINDWWGLDLTTTANVWKHFSLQVGPYSYLNELATNWYVAAGAPTWTNIDSIRFFQNPDSGLTGSIWVDGLNFSGWILRGARDDTKITSQKAIVELIVDNIGKDDSGKDDDSYVMASLAKATLYRDITTPIIGEICIPGQETILPGQLAHIHFGKKADSNFNIDKDMRITQVVERVNLNQGYVTNLSLTDDVKNSRPMQPHKGYNLILDATNPNFQNRERASVKTREIDITQPILSKNYNT